MIAWDCIAHTQIHVCTHMHSHALFDNCLNDLLSLTLFFLSPFLTLSLPSPPPLSTDLQVVSSCQKHTLPLTHGWQWETEGARESTGLTHTHTQRKEEAISHLWLVPCHSAAVFESANVSQLCQDIKNYRVREGALPKSHCQRMSRGWGNVKALLALD